MSIHSSGRGFTLHTGDAADVALWDLEPGSVQAIVTSPPYFGLRDYDHPDQIGREPSLSAYVDALVETFRALRLVLADDGLLWLNLGDSYASDPGRGRGASSALQGRKHGDAQMTSETSNRKKAGVQVARKNLLGVPWRVALALQDDGWILRSDIIWAKPNPMPESVRDRPTKAHEYLFLLAKSPRYYWDADGAKEAATGQKAGNKSHKYSAAYEADQAAGRGQEHRTKSGLLALGGQSWEKRNMRDVWTIGSSPFREAHFATFPPELPLKAILASTRLGDTVLDPFAGSSTTGMVALEQGRNYIGIDSNAEYHDLALRSRLAAFA